MTKEEYNKLKPGDLVRIKPSITRRQRGWNDSGQMDWLLDHKPVKVVDIDGSFGDADVVILGARTREKYELGIESYFSGWRVNYEHLEVVSNHPIAAFKYHKKLRLKL